MSKFVAWTRWEKFTYWLTGRVSARIYMDRMMVMERDRMDDERRRARKRHDVRVGDGFEASGKRWIVTAIDYATGKVTTGLATEFHQNVLPHLDQAQEPADLTGDGPLGY